MISAVISNTVDTVNHLIEVTHGITPAATLEAVSPVCFRAVGGSVPSTLVAAQLYYAYVYDSTHLSVHTTRQGGLDGSSNRVSLTGNGTGVTTLYIPAGAMLAGTIGTDAICPACAKMLNGINCDSDMQLSMGGRSETEYYVSATSLVMQTRGRWRFRHNAASGDRSLSVWVKQAANQSPRPTIVVRENRALGLMADAVATAGSGTGWVQIGPVNFTLNANGAVWVTLEANYHGNGTPAPCYWDTVVRS